MILPDAAMDLRPEGPLRVAQFTEEGVYAVVDLPPFGFAWVPKESNAGSPLASDRRLAGTWPPDPQRIGRDRDRRRDRRHSKRDGCWRVDGSAGAATRHDWIARRARQTCHLERCVASDSKSITAGPHSFRQHRVGSLVDPERNSRLASFSQRFRLWVGRPIIEIEITLSDLDPAWLERAATADPWSCYLACRWAWPDPNSMLRRGVFYSPEITDVERPETPEFFDISTRSQRTAILFKGLPYHRKHGSRMLDTLLDCRP